MESIILGYKVPQRQTNQTTAALQIEVPKPVIPDKVTDMAFLKQFTGGNPDKMNKYIGMFLDNAPKLLATIKSSLEQKDYPQVKVAAHSLKPQLSYMGVKEDLSHIFMMEQTAGESAHHDRLPQLLENLEMVCDKAFEELKTIAAT